MKRIALPLACLLAAFSAHGQIYQYKDAAGRTVYSDQPPAGGATKGRTITTEAPAASAPPAGNAPAAQGKSLGDRDMEYKKRQKEQQEAAAKAEKEAADKAARKEDCTRAQRALQALDSGQRIATTDDKGERTFLDDNQRAAEAERLRKAAAELCK